MVLHCLKASNSLRKQMFSTFGVAALISLMVVVVSSVVNVYSAGEIIKAHSSELMITNVADVLKTSSKLLAEKLTARVAEVESTLQILSECLQDRIVGYPSMDGWQDGNFVPFIDSITQAPKYPLAMPPVPLDWTITTLLQDIANDTILGERARWFNKTKISTATAAFHFQGACNPDPDSSDWVEGCSDSHNNVTSGGVIHPTNSHFGLYQSTGDLSVFMKPLYESQEDAIQLKIYFVNDGAGATLAYPASQIPPSSQTYTSFGCDWMLSTNDRTGEPYGSADLCRSSGEKVKSRNFNPMEQPWAPFFLETKENQVAWFGPLIEDPSTMIAGKPIYDRLTGSLIGFVTADIALEPVEEALYEDASLSDMNEIFIIDYDTGALLTSRELHEHPHDWASDMLTHLSASALNMSDEVVLHYDHLISVHPLSLPPEDHNGDFIPQFLVIYSVPIAAIPVLQEINEAIDEDMRWNAAIFVVLGVVGSILVLIILWGVSAALTDPLLWIEDVARRILRDNKSHRRITLDGEGTMHMKGAWRYVPTTEIFLLVKEFQNVLSGLSGDGVSKVACPTPISVKNVLSYNPEFEQYYGISDSEKQLLPLETSLRRNSKSRFTNPTTDIVSLSSASFRTNTTCRSNPKIKKFPNAGPVVNQSLIGSKPVREMQGSARIWRSSLFRWIVIFIIVPLVLTNIVLVTLVVTRITTSIPKWLREAEEGSEMVVKQSLLLIATTKATVISTLVGSAIRDLHFMTRVSGWLFFNGVTRSDTFTQGRTAAEECKSYLNGLCPFFPDASKNPCSCDWDDAWSAKPWPGCFDYPNVTDTRFLQQYQFFVQSTDADKETGNRMSSPSFPKFGSTSDTTYWWTDAKSVPGSYKGANASGYETTYDRIRVASAASSVFFPIYNYATSLGREKPALATFLGFEKDGLLQGYDGCYGVDGEAAFARSTSENGAAEIAPSLCPEGKYGYDPRCRDWYATGKRLYNKSNVAVHLTSPYTLQVSQGTIATGATSPIANMETGEYVGQVLYTYNSVGLLKSIKAVDETLSFVITPGEDINGGDTVIGLDKEEGWKSASICDEMFPNKNVAENGFYMQEFDLNVLSKMKQGESGLAKSRLLGKDGSKEDFYLAFAPVTYTILLPTNPGNFSAGVLASKNLLYSVAIGETMSNIKAPFNSAFAEATEDLKNPRNTHISIIALVTFFYVMFTIFVAILVTTPIITLLEIVRDINRGIFSEDIPPLLGGCRESMRVFSIFSRLNKIVMVSNTAFFAHDMDRANHFLTTALHLFRKIDDEKAIGVASNNLANTLCAKIYEHSSNTQSGSCGTPCLVREASRHYEKSINVAQKAFESAAVRDKAVFAERLGDRLFNRGIFLVFCSQYDCAPGNAKEQGYEDISRASKIHYEMKDYLLEKKLLFEQSGPYWNRLMRKIHCLLALYHDDGLREVWDAETLLDEADQLMIAAWQIPSAPLFHEVTPTGRRQQLEGAALLLCRHVGQDEQAFHLSMRMFAQDQYLLESSFVPAAETLLQIGESGEMELSSTLCKELRQMLQNKTKCPMECLTMEKF